MNEKSDRIQQLINTLHLSKKEFAVRLNRSTGNISDWISGRANPSKNSMKIICKTFQVSYEWLNEGVGPMFIHDNEFLENKKDNSALHNLTIDEEILLDIYQEMSKTAKRRLQVAARKLLTEDKAATPSTMKSPLLKTDRTEPSAENSPHQSSPNTI